MLDLFAEPTFTRYYKQFPFVLGVVGASGGYPSDWKPAHEYLQVIGFEPDKRSFATLADTASPNTRYLNVALYKEKGSLNLYLTRTPNYSSILKPNRKVLDRNVEPGRWDVLEISQIETDTMDNQLHSHQINYVDFITLDTQGSELFVLEGATRSLSNTFGLSIEVSFVPRYQEQPLFSDVNDFVRKFGFELFNLRPRNWKQFGGSRADEPKEQLIFSEALYLREIESYVKSLDETPMGGDGIWKKTMVLRAISICTIYGTVDHALELLISTNNLFSREEYRMLAEDLELRLNIANKRGSVGVRAIIPNFRGRGRIANMLYNLSQTLQPKTSYGISGGQHLRNSSPGSLH
jgi:FkbM family methyltransferase